MVDVDTITIGGLLLVIFGLLFILWDVVGQCVREARKPPVPRRGPDGRFIK